jgi:RNA polymerase sigma factor (sigma-70 family)
MPTWAATLSEIAYYFAGNDDAPADRSPTSVRHRATHPEESDAHPPRYVHDLALIERIRHDDTEALATLARAYMVSLSGVAYAVLGSDALVDDVVQDVLVALWERRATLQIRGSVAGYLAQATRHRALNVLRHERTERRSHAVVAIPEREQSVRNDAEEWLQAADAKSQLSRLLASIPARPREVLLLSLGGSTYAEIADALGLTVPSVRTLMYRATQRLTHTALRLDVE